ncbi:hypothetical protein D8I30_09605 [Brevundimonas naejangsanensis]|uniref:Chemotaxis protein n=1 Tax=Brevundimonas naejangsanensis TaxID=588932 RepID=A0A494RN00_9CAUL|nr:hypothetical protein [Brevundimonas naejangsanensis]AYG95402.1 hypothetical protein D8I30_09605 [Brevundimonas naejangsanensis]
MQTADHPHLDVAAPVDPSLSAISDQLESARGQIEARFSDAGGRLAGSLDMVGRLIDSLDHLGSALNADTVSGTTRDLLSTADGLTALPDAQHERIVRMRRLRETGGILASHIDEMRQTLRYLRAFAMNVKITASAIGAASDEFSGFAEQMCSQLDVGGGELDELARQLSQLDRQLSDALDFEQVLSGKYQAVIPAVPDKLAIDAQAIGVHHARIAAVTASVAAIARDIQMKVARALTALQIGDITRQRIEHVQTGLSVTTARLAASGLAPDSRARAERRLVRLLADQMGDTASAFETEAAKVAQSLDGMAQDTAQILAFKGLADTQGSGGLRDLESGLAQARVLVGDVGAAMDNANRISDQTASTVETLTHRVDVIFGVKRDIQQMAINSSLSCNRLGEVGKPLNVIALELSSHAVQLEESADQTLDALTRLASAAEDMTDKAVAAIDATRLDSVSGRLRRAADVIEHDLGQLGATGAETARSLELATGQLGLREDLGETLHAAAIALTERAGPADETLAEIADVVTAAMDEIALCYTMARERTIHAGHAIGAAADEAVAPSAPAEDEFDDLLF